MAEVEKGTRVKAAEGGRFDRASGYGYRTIEAGAVGVTTSKVKNQMVSVKFDDIDWAIRIFVGHLIPEDPDAPRPRRLGEVPDGMLSPLDPRFESHPVDAP